MNKILIGSILLILVIIGISLYSDSKNDIEDKTTENNEQVENPGELEVFETKDKENILDLSGQNLSTAPSDIFSQVSLVELDLSNNRITGSLQAEVRLLEKLRVLDLSNNNFTGVPAEVGQLANLEVLNLANNQLSGLPLELGNLKSIKQIDLRGNAYAKQDLEAIKVKLGSMVVILVD